MILPVNPMWGVNNNFVYLLSARGIVISLPGIGIILVEGLVLAVLVKIASAELIAHRIKNK